MDEEQMRQLGQRVRAARLGRGLGKEAAAREVGVSSITLKRVEDGLSVRDDSLAKVLRFFDLPMPGQLNVETSFSERDAGLARELIEGADIDQALKDRLLGVLPDAPPPSPTDERKRGTA